MTWLTAAKFPGVKFIFRRNRDKISRDFAQPLITKQFVSNLNLYARHTGGLFSNLTEGTLDPVFNFHVHSLALALALPVWPYMATFYWSSHIRFYSPVWPHTVTSTCPPIKRLSTWLTIRDSTYLTRHTSSHVYVSDHILQNLLFWPCLVPFYFPRYTLSIYSQLNPIKWHEVRCHFNGVKCCVFAGAFKVIDPTGRSGQQHVGHGGAPSGGWSLTTATPSHSPPLPTSAVTAPPPKCRK